MCHCETSKIFGHRSGRRARPIAGLVGIRSQIVTEAGSPLNAVAQILFANSAKPRRAEMGHRGSPTSGWLKARRNLEVGMEVGIYAFATDAGLRPFELAQAVEERGFGALMFPEHSHIPVARATAYPDVYGGGELPDFYKRTFDPFVSCSMVAAATTRLRMGTGICLLALRDPVNTAKEVASVDYLSNGRFNFGVGFGWNEDEFITAGIPFKGRHELVREKVALMKEIWTKEVASFDGKRVSLQPSWAWPKPASTPYPQIFLGGSGPLSMKHAIEWADVWYPTPPGPDPLLVESVPKFRALCEEMGRDPATIKIGCAPGDASTQDLDTYAEVGVDYVNIGLVTTSRDEDLARLDDLGERAKAYLVKS